MAIIECQYAGVVRRVGPGMKNLRVVVAFAAGSFASRLKSERLCARKARRLSWAEAATMPCVFAAALYSLVDVARLPTGDATSSAYKTVYVHSACGGIRLAAIHVCTMVGAEVYLLLGVTARPLSGRHWHSQGRIFRPRNNTFLYDTLSATGGRRFDVALNSLSGGLLHASWQCVADFVMMIELGERDFIGKGHLAMETIEPNRTFTGVELGLICERRPDLTRG
ncbi:hypothetical protein BDV10DRAFT_181458 [Aspergillus recurvatus]